MVRASALAVVLTAASTFATGCGGHGRASGTIVFESGFSGREALYAIHPDGTGTTRLPLDLPPDGADVAWTRDGSKAVVVYDTGSGKTVAFVFDSAGRTRRPLRLPGLNWISDMPWSPDGTRLVLGVKDGDVVFDVKTGARHPIDAANGDQLLSWSGDGKLLLFTSGHGIYAAPADGGPEREIVAVTRPGVVGLFGLESSSDGKWIAFIENGETRTVGLYAVRSNGTGLRLIARDAESSAWSPTGDRLAFASEKGIALVDVENGHQRVLTSDRLDDPTNEPPAWSPDGKWVLYRRNDLGFGAPPAYHEQLWTMKADGTGNHRITNAFPVDSGDEQAVWVEAAVAGGPAPKLPLVSLTAARTMTTGLPIVALGAAGDRAAVAQGFGGPPGLRGPLGPIVVWNRSRGTKLLVPVRGCGSAFDVLLAAGLVGYRCDNAGNDYTVDDSLRLGTAELVRTHGEEFTGSFLGGLVAEGNTIAFDVESAGNKSRGEFRIRQTRVWKARPSRKALVRTFRGEVTVASLDAGRIAVLRDGAAVSVITPAGELRTFGFGGHRVLGAALDGPRLIVLQPTTVTVIDVRSGRRVASWRVRRGFGPAPELDGAQGDLATYVVGASIHVLRLSDGHEIVVDTPNATEPVFARFTASGLFYSFNAAYMKRPGRLVFVTRSQLERALGRSKTLRHATTRCPPRASSILNPVESPNGTQIAWLSSCRGSTVQVWVASANGSSAHLLASDIPSLYQLAWVGAAGLLYTVIDDQLWHLSKDGKRSLVVSQFQPSAQQIPVDAVGDRVAWGVPRCACQGPIRVKSLVNGWTRAVANNPTFSDDNPTLSPDGRRVAFERRVCPKFAECRKLAGIWVSSIASGRAQQIARSGYFPVWSPDGRWILYDDGHGYLVVVAPDGHRRTTLPVAGTAKAPAPNFAWSPDSRSVAVWSRGPLRVFNVASGRAHAVTSSMLGGVTGFAWSPDSATLLVATAKPSSCSSLWSVRADGLAKRLLRHC